MENLQSWLLPSIIVLIGILAKFLMEVYLPESPEGKKPIKKIFINSCMALFLLYLLGNMAFTIQTEPWSQNLKVLILFQAFLSIVLVAFLVIMRIFNDFFEDVSADSEHGERRLKQLENGIFMRN
ncbi:MAG TPA: hypothetical protein VJ894_03545 [Cryomorphaceae bacterium]|nr:hypothetical protein [Cryomorphaceae bacterium]